MKDKNKRKTLREKMLDNSKFYGKKVSDKFGYGGGRVSRRALERMPNLIPGDETKKNSLKELPRVIRKEGPSSSREERKGELRGALKKLPRVIKKEGAKLPCPRDEYQKKTGKSQVEVDKLWDRKRERERAVRRARRSGRGLRI